MYLTQPRTHPERGFITGKMTLTINPEIYSQLLSKYQPRIIKTEAENDKFLEVVEELLSRPNITPEENTLLELFVNLLRILKRSIINLILLHHIQDFFI